MKICVISTTVLPCPPPGYSGLEMVAWQQANELAKLGHQVLLVAPQGSVAPDGVELHQTTLREHESQAYSGYWNRLLEYDAIIDNSWEKWSYVLKMEGRLAAPILGVLHAPAHTMYNSAPPVQYPCLVSISNDQGVAASECWGVSTRTAYNGIDLDFYKPSSEPRIDNLLFLARISKIKGPHIAIDVARKCRMPLDVVGDDTLTQEPQYKQQVYSKCTHNIVYHGGKNREECVRFFNTRSCLLHMNLHFREPFGLAPVEAQACGMPVIAFDNGAMREVLNGAETAFLVKTQEEVEMIVNNKAYLQIDPARCREWASQFSVQNMAKRYESLIIEAIETGGW